MLDLAGEVSRLAVDPLFELRTTERLINRFPLIDEYFCRESEPDKLPSSFGSESKDSMP